SMLKAEGAKMRNLGAATVGGVATTHYRITVDVAKTLKASGLASPLRQTVAKSPAVPVDVWIGKDGLLHRIQLSFRSSHERRFLGMTLDIYDYGAHVTIAAPPSRDVFDATQLAQQGFGSAFSH